MSGAKEIRLSGLWSLWGMRTFFAAGFFEACRVLGHWSRMNNRASDILPTERRTHQHGKAKESRYAGAVFHSVQIVEAGLIELGLFLKVTDPLSGWTAVSKALKVVIDKDHKKRTRFEQRNFKFLEQLQGTVEGLKNGWRNKISHTQGRLVLMTADFSPDVAEEILFATRSFMRRLAEGLPPPKTKKDAG
jgi:hypothetical protein